MNPYWHRYYQHPKQDSRFFGFGLLPFVAGLAIGPLLFNPFLYGRPYPRPYPVYPPPYPPYPPYPYPPYPGSFPPGAPYGAYPGQTPYGVANTVPGQY